MPETDYQRITRLLNSTACWETVVGDLLDVVQRLECKIDALEADLREEIRNKE